MAQLLLQIRRAQKRFLPAVAVFDICNQTSKPEDARSKKKNNKQK
jgi:hypothetical protein